MIKLVQQKTLRKEGQAPRSLEEELALAKGHDPILGPPKPGEWRAGIGQREREQTLREYQAHHCPQAIKARRTLRIHQLSQFSPAELKALRIVADYLTAVHDVAVVLEPEAHSIETLRQRHIEKIRAQPISAAWKQRLEATFGQPRQRDGHRQYHVDHLLNMMDTQLHGNDKTSFSLGFTKEDLYAHDLNFCFGVANYGGGGLFSIHRLGNANGPQEEFKLCVKRLMKIASHEFAHMRGIEHCKNHPCNIQGYNTLGEADRGPHYFCAQDMAKIAHCNGQSLKEGYKRHLEFLVNFSQKYGLRIDFSEDIANLRARIRTLRG